MKKNNLISLKQVLQKKLHNKNFRFYFEESQFLSEICTSLAQKRQELGISQESIADMIGTSQSVIARLENGNQGKIPSLSLLNRIARALKLNLVVGFEKKRAVGED